MQKLAGFRRELESAGLDERELAYVEARTRTTKDAPAFRQAGVPERTFYTWPRERRHYLNGLAVAWKRYTVGQVLGILEENATEAARVKAKGLKSRREDIAQQAADSILDRVLGKPTVRVKQRTEGYQIARIVMPDERRKDRVAATPRDSE